MPFIRFPLLLHFICGLAFAAGLPPVSQIWLAAVALSSLTVLSSVLPSTTRRREFLRGLMFGLGYFSVALHWIGFAFLIDAANTLWMMPFAVGGLALFMASYWGVAFVVVSKLERLGLQRWLILPAVLGLVEWLRGYLFTGFPWAAPGLMADGMGGVLQLASIAGMPGVTVLILLWLSLPGVIFTFWKGGWSAIAFPAVLLVTLPLAWVWGQQRLTQTVSTPADAPLIRLVQPNTSQSDKWRDENKAEIFSGLIELSQSAPGKKPAVIIWPESAVPFLLDETDEALQRIADTLTEGQVLLTGAIRRQKSADREDYFTSILLIDEHGSVIDAYDKWRLVPGGEYLPFEWLLEPLGFTKIANLPESFSAGKGPSNINVPNAGAAAMLICYEAIFPHRLVPDADRPRWIVNVTNDGWFGRSVGPAQHLAQVRMRAVEQGLPIARAANTGISAVIDPIGNYAARTELESRSTVDVLLPSALAPTLFARFGLLAFATLCMGLVAAAWANARPRG